MTRPITDTLRLLNGGAFLDEASVELARLVRHINEHGGAGKIVLELTVKRSAAGSVAAAGKVTLKLPTAKPEETLMWSTDDGQLVLDNPKQHKLDLKVVHDDKPGELRTAG